MLQSWAQSFFRTLYNKRLKYSKSCDNRGPTASPTDNHRLHSEAAVFNRLHVTIYNQMSHTLQPDVSSPHIDATSPPAKMSKWTLFVFDFPYQWRIPLHCDWHWLFKYSNVLLFQQKHSLKISLIICRFSSYICFSHWCFHVCVFDFLHRMY